MARSAMVRVYVMPEGNGRWFVLPGGMTRVAKLDDSSVSMQRGGSSLDTWVLTDGPVDSFSMLPSRLGVDDIAARRPPVSSRTAENLFWLGRYTERTEQMVRLARAVLMLIDTDNDAPEDLREALSELAVSSGLAPWGAPTLNQAPHLFERALLAALADPGASSIAFNLGALERAAQALRERLSTEQWGVVRSMGENFGSLRSRAGRTACPRCRRCCRRWTAWRVQLAAVTGAQSDRMTRDHGWRFLTVGRLLERLIGMSSQLGTFVDTGALRHGAGMELMLELFDSAITFRARYQRHEDLLALTDLLVLDSANPRVAGRRAAAPAHRAAQAARRRRVRRHAAAVAAARRGRRRAAGRRCAVPTSRTSCACWPRSAQRLRAMRQEPGRRHRPPLLRACELPAMNCSASEAAAMTVIEVVHETRYRYAAAGDAGAAPGLPAAAAGRAPATARARAADRARRAAAARSDVDAYGNQRVFFSLTQPHRELRVRARSRVALAPQVGAWRADRSPAWEAVCRRLRYEAGARYDPAVEFAQPSPYVPRLAPLRDYGAASFAAGLPVALGALDLMRRIHADFELPDRQHRGRHALDRGLRAAQRRVPGLCPPDDRGAAHARPGGALCQRLPVDDAAAGAAGAGRRRCLACLGAGVLPGHAGRWPSGWLELDPTNNLVPDTRHVRLALGRDYGDVTPLRGVIRGGGRHSLDVRVDTRCLEPAQARMLLT